MTIKTLSTENFLRTEAAKAFFSPRFSDNSVEESVKTILEKVASEGDAALRNFSKHFDKLDLHSFEIPLSERKKAASELKKTKPELYKAIQFSYKNALRFAKKQKKSFGNFEMEIAKGVFTGQKNIPVEKAGIYVPAGRYPLFSSLIMGAAPAQAAGVEKIILCTPPRLHPKDAQKQEHAEKNNKKIALKPWADETTLAVSYICKIDTVYALGGAQAIAAMAYGTETIPQVDVIVGPGNKYVAEAKRLVYGKVGIDFIAGPTEVFIIADESARASWVAADLLAQAEHDPDAQAILATNSEKLIAEVKTEIQKQISLFPEPEAALQSLKENGLILLCKDLDEAIEIANKKAPEHLEIALDDTKERKKLVEKARNYGSLFIGHEAAEVFGDYCAGLNHTLPTSGSARFTGGLSVRHFIKTLTTLRAHNQESIQEIAKHSALIGRSEGLIGHARAAEIRFQNSQD